MHYLQNLIFNNIYRDYMKYKKRKEIKQYIARKKMCSVTKVAYAFVLVTDMYKQLTWHINQLQ